MLAASPFDSVVYEAVIYCKKNSFEISCHKPGSFSYLLCVQNAAGILFRISFLMLWIVNWNSTVSWKGFLSTIYRAVCDLSEGLYLLNCLFNELRSPRQFARKLQRALSYGSGFFMFFSRVLKTSRVFVDIYSSNALGTSTISEQLFSQQRKCILAEYNWNFLWEIFEWRRSPGTPPLMSKSWTMLFYSQNSMLLCVCSVIDRRWCQNVVRTKKWHSRLQPSVWHLCSYHILTSSAIYYWTDAL